MEHTCWHGIGTSVTPATPAHAHNWITGSAAGRDAPEKRHGHCWSEVSAGPQAVHVICCPNCHGVGVGLAPSSHPLCTAPCACLQAWCSPADVTAAAVMSGSLGAPADAGIETESSCPAKFLASCPKSRVRHCCHRPSCRVNYTCGRYLPAGESGPGGSRKLDNTWLPRSHALCRAHRQCAQEQGKYSARVVRNTPCLEGNRVPTDIQGQPAVHSAATAGDAQPVPAEAASSGAM